MCCRWCNWFGRCLNTGLFWGSFIGLLYLSVCFLSRACLAASRNLCFGHSGTDQFHQADFDEEVFVVSLAETEFKVGGGVEIAEQKRQPAQLGLLCVALAECVASIDELECLRVEADHEVAQVLAEAGEEVLSAKSFTDYFLIQQQRMAQVSLSDKVQQAEIVVGIKDVEVFQHPVSGEVTLREVDQLVKDGESVAQATFGLGGNNFEGALLIVDAFVVGHKLEVPDDIVVFYTFEVEYLATAQDGGDDFVFFGSGEDEFGIGRGFLEGLQESVEGRRTQHVDLVDDVYLEFAHLRGDVDLFHQFSHIVHGIVRSGVELENAHRGALVETPAAVALVAGLAVGGAVFAVDGFGQDTRTGRLAHASGTAEEESLGQLAGGDGVLQGPGDMLLPYDAGESRGAIFSCRYYKIIHIE